MRQTLVQAFATMIGRVANQLTSGEKDSIYRALNTALEDVYAVAQWPELTREVKLLSPPKETATVTLTAGSATFSAASGLKTRVFDGHYMIVGDADYQIGWIKAGTTGYLREPFSGTTGSYSVQFCAREVYLPNDIGLVTAVYYGNQPLALFNQSLTTANESRSQYGYTMGVGRTIPTPASVEGVVAATSGTGHGARTIVVYQAYAEGLNSFSRESELSAKQTFSLNDTQLLQFTAVQTPNKLGLYTTYYFTCAEAGINSPVLIPDAAAYFTPDNAATVTPNMNLSNLSSTLVKLGLNRHSGSNGAYRSLRFADSQSFEKPLVVRYQRRPDLMTTDNSSIDLPSAYEQVILNAALFHYYKTTEPDKAQTYYAVYQAGLKERNDEATPSKISFSSTEAWHARSGRRWR